MRSTIQVDAAFPLSRPAQRIRNELGCIGLFTFDMAFRRSFQDQSRCLVHINNDSSFCAEIGLPGLALHNEQDEPWTALDLWSLTGQLKLTRRRVEGGLVVVVFPGFTERFVRRERTAIPTAVRRAVLERDEHCCVTCGRSDDLQMDHRFPWSLGGDDTIENLQTMCGACNRAKRDKVESDILRVES